MGHSAFSVFRGCRPSRDRSSDGVRDFSSKGKSTRKKVLQCIFHPFLFYILHVLRLCLHGLSPFLLGHLLWQITVVGHGINYASTMDGRHHADSIAVRDFFETLSLTSAQCLFFLFWFCFYLLLFSHDHICVVAVPPLRQMHASHCALGHFNQNRAPYLYL